MNLSSNILYCDISSTLPHTSGSEGTDQTHCVGYFIKNLNKIA